MNREHLLFLFVFISFLLPQILRISSGNQNIIGYPTYRLARVSDLFVHGSFYDPLSYQGSFPVYPPGYFFVLGTMSVALQTNVYFVAALLGPLMGALSSVFISKLFDKRATLIFVLTPITMYLFSHAGSRTIPFLFGLIALYFHKRSKTKLSLLFILLSSLSHPEVAAVFLLLLIFEGLGNLKRSLAFAAAVLLPYTTIVLLFGLPAQNSLHVDYSLPGRASLHPSTLDELVSFFNNPYAAISLPLLLLALYSFRDFDKKYLLFLLAVLGMSLIFQRFRIYLGLAVALFAATTSAKLRARTFLIALLLMAPYMVEEMLWMSSIGPSQCFVSLMPDSGTWEETVISNWAFGHWIESLADKKTFMDGSAEYVPDANRRFAEFMAIYTYGNATSLRLLESNSIDYLLLLQSDYGYFAAKGLSVTVENLGLEVLKNKTCGVLYSTH
jgi:hypothetical protein